MSDTNVSLAVPAQADFARTVRMLAANLAVVGGMSVDDVEDVRMAAEEGFVYSCATGIDTCRISFVVEPGSVSMEFGLGEGKLDADDTSGAYVELILAAVCDEFEAKDGVLRLTKRAGAADA